MLSRWVGHRSKSIACHSSSSSSGQKPSSDLTGAARSRACQPSRSRLYRASRSRCRSAAPVDSATASRPSGPRFHPPRPRSASPLLGQDPQGGRRRRRAQPGGPGHLGVTGLVRAELLVHERCRPTKHQKRRVRHLGPASPAPPPADLSAYRAGILSAYLSARARRRGDTRSISGSSSSRSSCSTRAVVRLDRAKCRARFRHPNSITLDPSFAHGVVL
jgi:hypothetical protein